MLEFEYVVHYVINPGITTDFNNKHNIVYLISD